MNETRNGSDALQTKLKDLNDLLWELDDIAAESGQEEVAFFFSEIEIVG